MTSRKTRAHKVNPQLVRATCVVAFILILFAVFFMNSGRLGWFPIKYVKFNGGAQVTLKDIQKHCHKLIGHDIFSVKLTSLQNCMSQMGWVKSVAISRKLPSTLLIAIEEEVPVAAAWNQEWMLISANHRFIAPVRTEALIRYPLIPQYDQLTPNLQKESVRITSAVSIWSTQQGTAVSDLTWDAKKGWVVTLTHGTLVYLGHSIEEANIQRLHVLLKPFENVLSNAAVIDLRIGKKIIVKGHKRS